MCAGTPEERGVRKLKRGSSSGASEVKGMRSYDLPFGMDFLRRHSAFQYLPISPTFSGYQWKRLGGACRGRGCSRGGDEGGAVRTEAGESRV